MLSNLSLRMMGIRAPILESKRAPRGALASLQYQLPGQAIYPELDGEVAIEQAYLKNIYTYRCIDTIASEIAGWPFRSGDQVTYKFRLNHPLAQLLGPASGSANPNMSSYTLWRYSIAQYLLMGKFAWAVERDGSGDIVGLWPLQSQHIYPVAAESGANYFEYFKYGVLGQPGYQEFQPNDIVYIYRPSLKDVRQPESPVQSVSVNINISKMLDQFDFSFLKNGGVPAHLIVTPPWATDQDRDNFQQQFMADFSGSANVGKAMFAERDIEPGDTAGGPGYDTVDVKTIGISQRDAQTPLLRDAEIQAICLAWGVPLSIMGDASHRTFSNAEDERLNYIQRTCLPRAREIADGINTHLAPLLDPTRKAVGWFDTSGVPELKPAPLFTSDSEALKMLEAEVITKDEYRTSKGLPVAEDVGLDSKMKQPESLANIVPAPAAKDAGADVLPAQNSPSPKSRHAGHEHEPIPSGHITKRTLESALTFALRRALEEMAGSVAERAAGKRAKRGETDLVDVGYWSKRIADVIQAHALEDMVPVTEVETALMDLYVGNATASSIIERWKSNV